MKIEQEQSQECISQTNIAIPSNEQVDKSTHLQKDIENQSTKRTWLTPGLIAWSLFGFAFIWKFILVFCHFYEIFWGSKLSISQSDLNILYDDNENNYFGTQIIFLVLTVIYLTIGFFFIKKNWLSKLYHRLNCNTFLADRPAFVLFFLLFIINMISTPFSILLNFAFNFLQDICLSALVVIFLVAVFLSVASIFLSKFKQRWQIALFLTVCLQIIFQIGDQSSFLILGLGKSALERNSSTEQIYKYLEKNQFPVDKLYIADGVENAAYVSVPGKEMILMGSKFIDTSYVMSILSHEIGHRQNNHALKKKLFHLIMDIPIHFFSSLIVLSFPQIYEAFGFSGTPLLAFIPIVDIIDSVFSKAFKPLTLYISRRFEYEADSFAVMEGYGSDLIHGLVKMDKNFMYDHSTLIECLCRDHPTTINRIKNIERLNENLKNESKK